MSQAKNLLPAENHYTPITLSIVVANIVTGISIYCIQQHSTWLQWNMLFHLVTGVACSVVMLPYFIIHFRRTIGFRRTPLLLSGLLTIPLFLLFIVSGWHLAVFGQLENSLWIFHTHVISAFIFVAATIAHIVFHFALMPEKRKSQSNVNPILAKKSLQFIVIFNLLLQLVVFGASFIYQSLEIPYSTQPIVKNYQYSYGNHPFRPSQTETASNTFIDQQQIANSHRCISCHPKVSQQWMSSVHRQAASDPTYVTNVSLLADKKGISATRYCEGCHAPIALLTGELSPGGQHGGIANSPANIEGVSCMGCHGIQSLTHLKGVASYTFKPAEDYLFSQSNNSILMRINNWLIRAKPDQHKLDLGNPLLKDAKFCSACHTQFMDKDMNNWGWIKMQDEYKAWLEGPYSLQHKESFSNSSVVRCQDCHMPLIVTNDPSADTNNQIRSHHFPGANTVLPTLRNDQEQMNETIQFLQSNKLRVSIEKPNRKDAVQNLQALDEKLRSYEEAPYYYYLGEHAEMNVIVSNNGVGHNFPGGTIDINQAWVEFLVLDAESRTVYHTGFIDENSYVDENAYFYRSIPIDRYGKHVWKHDLFNMVGTSFKRIIPAGESDLVRFSFTIPSWAKSPLTVTSTLKYRKLNQRYAQWALNDLYVEIPVVNIAWDSLSIPIKIKKEVEIPPSNMNNTITQYER